MLLHLARRLRCPIAAESAVTSLPGAQPGQAHQHAASSWRPLQLTDAFRRLNSSGTIDWASIPTDSLLVVDQPPAAQSEIKQMGPADTYATANASSVPTASPLGPIATLQQMGTHFGMLGQAGESQLSAATFEPLQAWSAEGQERGFGSASWTRDRQHGAVGSGQQGIMGSHQRRLLARPMHPNVDGPMGPLLDAVNAYQAMGYDCPLFARKFGEEAAPAVGTILAAILQDQKSPSAA